ncbi:MAG: GldG family protein [Candidatus Omnitrophica bacterium]|nr:GldG family protein [Candidatus Omnitrophota bacterium]
MKPLRKAAIGTNFVAVILVSIVLLLMVNYLSLRHYRTLDWTRNKLNTLSTVTGKMLNTLPETVRVTVFFTPGHSLYDEIENLSRLYQKEGRGKIEVDFVDVDADPARAQMLAERLKVDQLNVVAFECGERRKVVTESEIAEYDYRQMQFGGAPQMLAFKGEDAFTSAIKTVLETTQKKVYFLTGQGEKDTEDYDKQNGYSEAKKHLERNNFKVEKLSLFGKSEIPQDADLLVIPGPNKAYPQEELTIIGKYLDNGGKALIFVDPLVKTGLETFLSGWNVEIGNNIVVDPSMRLPFVSGANLIINDYPYHDVVKEMKGSATIYFLACSVQPSAGVKEGLKVKSIAQTSEKGWGETRTDEETLTYNAGEDKKGPLSIAVVVEEESAGDEKAKALRVIVVGDSDFASNGQIGSLGNSDFFMNSVNWLIGKEGMLGINPKVPEYVKLTLTARQANITLLLSIAGLPILTIALGVIVWWRRRS